MARIGPMNVDVGNYTYPFVVYDLEGPIYNAPGIYIFSKWTTNAQDEIDPQYLYIGQTEAFRERLNPNHEKWDDARDLGMNCIFVYVPQPTESRFDIERNLIEHLKPPLNDQLITEESIPNR